MTRPARVSKSWSDSKKIASLRAGSAKRVAPIVGFRHRVVHLYDRIDPLIVYRVVSERRTELLALLDFLLAIDAEPSA